MGLVEKIKNVWYEWIPGWLPIVLGLCWVAMQYQKVNDRLDTVETQIKAIQEYMRHEHQKSYTEVPDSMLKLPRKPEETATE